MAQAAHNMMSFLAPSPSKTVSRGQKRSITFKVTDDERDMIDWAAAAAGENRTEFLVKSARERAINFLADQRVFRLDSEDWDAFTAALDDDALPSAAMVDFMNEPSPWQET